MPLIRCTSKLLSELDDAPVDTDDSTPSAIGDWCAQIFTVNRRKCVIFLHEPTLFVCLAIGVVKADYRKIGQFFRKVLAQTLQFEQFSEEEAALVLGLHADLGVGKGHDRSVLGSLNNRVSDAKFMIQRSLDTCDVGGITHLLNTTPMKPIGYSDGLRQMRILVAELGKRHR
jgi:hypothetical protein